MHPLSKIQKIEIIFLLFVVLLSFWLIYWSTGKILWFCKSEKEPEGILSEAYPPLKIDLYIAESQKYKVKYNDSDIKEILDGVNEIWKNYNITFEIRNITRVANLEDNVVYTDSNSINEIYNLTKTVIKNDSLINDTIIDVIFVKEFDQNWFDKYFRGINNEAITYRGLNNVKIGNGTRNISVYLVVISEQGMNVSWDLAHEMGHVLGLVHFHPDNKYNLMTNGCNKQKYPTTLNQNQINTVKETAEGIIKGYNQ